MAFVVNLRQPVRQLSLTCIETEGSTEGEPNSNRSFRRRKRKAANSYEFTTYKVPPVGIEPTTY